MRVGRCKTKPKPGRFPNQLRANSMMSRCILISNEVRELLRELLMMRLFGHERALALKRLSMV
jgi:hypothetical protein